MLRLALISLLAGATRALDRAALSSLSELASLTNSTNSAINSLHDCGFISTTQAISNKTQHINGSACPSADETIAEYLHNLTDAHRATLSQLRASQPDSSISSNDTLAVFKQYSSAFYTLFNALDLAECAFILTAQSQSFAAQFDGQTGLRPAYEDLIAELKKEKGIGLRVLGSQLLQETHFGGTSLLATQVGGLRLIALTACTIITTIVESEGGGRN